jgi:hypothetical protein
MGRTAGALETLAAALGSKDLPHDWKDQRRFLGFAA